jgi:putative transposase
MANPRHTVLITDHPMLEDGLGAHHRRPVRLKGYDYSTPGTYFVPVVTNGYKCIFGKIIDTEMHNNHLGEIVSACWFGIPDHFSGIEVEPFVLMPNHIHGIITILDDDRRGTIYRAPTKEEFGQPTVRSIPTIVRTFKAAVSRVANEDMGIKKIWQRNYYEHIIRNQMEMEQINDYIQTNPASWEKDPENNPHVPKW